MAAREEVDSGRPGSVGAPSRSTTLWDQVRVTPIEIALPGGVGYTLRAYRSSTEIDPPAPAGEDAPVDDFDAAAATVASRRSPDRDTPQTASQEADDDLDPDLDEPDESDFADTDEDEDEAAEEAKEQEVPVFLGRGGRLYLFRSPAGLVEFVRASGASGAEHDMGQIDTWPELARRITVSDVVAEEEDTYELDLVVANLRGGPDAWLPELLLKAGEIARDIGFALRAEALVVALAPGSPLDDLDEALRAAEAGGIGALLARRRLRRMPTQQSSLGWRTLIGKISSLVEWRD